MIFVSDLFLIYGLISYLCTCFQRHNHDAETIYQHPKSPTLADPLQNSFSLLSGVNYQNKI